MSSPLDELVAITYSIGAIASSGSWLNHILDHLAKYQVENSALHIQEIIEALNVLEYNPLIGRPA